MSELEAIIATPKKTGRSPRDIHTTAEAAAQSEKKIVKKRGRRSWAADGLLNVHNKEDGFTYRWVSKDSKKFNVRVQKGWEVVGRDGGASTEHSDTFRIFDGKPLGDAIEMHDLILMRIPDEFAEEDRTRYNNTALQREKNFKKDLQSRLPSAPVTGSVELRNQVTTIIE